MAEKFMQLVLTPAVKAAQDRYFGRHYNADAPQDRDPLGQPEAAFIAARDSFYMATNNSDGWPYIQHRGGPPGFLKVLDPSHLGFADFKGNRQMISTGNLDGDDRVALFLMDYPNRRRLKILGHARVLDARENTGLAGQLSPAPELRSKIERLFLIEVVSYDWNCPQYITPRFTEAEAAKHIAALQTRINELEERLRQVDGGPK